MAVDYTVVARERLMADIIASGAQADLASRQITLSLPEATTLYDRNTRVFVTVLDDNDVLVDNLVVYYDRLPLSFIFGTATPSFSLSGLSTSFDLIPIILTLYDVQLDETDIIDTSAGENDLSINNLVASPNSYGWIGSVYISDVDITLLRTGDEFLVTTSDGFYIRMADFIAPG